MLPIFQIKASPEKGELEGAKPASNLINAVITSVMTNEMRFFGSPKNAATFYGLIASDSLHWILLSIAS